MPTPRLASFVLLGVALAACSEGPSRLTTAAPPHDAGAARVLPTPVLPDRRLELAPRLSSSAATRPSHHRRGRAGGRYTIDLFGTQTIDVAFEALSVGAGPGAKGWLHWHAVSGASTFDARVSVACLTIVGDEAWVSGSFERFTINGQPATPTLPYAEIHVMDEGRGALAPADQGSPLFYASTADACALADALQLFPSTRGRVEVR